MSDPYRITDAPAPPRGGEPARPGRTAMRTLLWLGIIVGGGINLATNLTGHTVVGIVAGSVATLCIIFLVVSHVSGRRR